MRKIFLFLAFATISFSLGSVAFAKLYPAFRKEFPEFVENLCSSTLPYDLGKIDPSVRADKREEEFQTHKDNYDNTVSCLLDRAIVERIKSTNEEVEEFFGRDISHPDFDFVDFEEEREFCDKDLVDKTLDKQQNLRLKNENIATNNFEPTTACIAEEFEGGKDPYSSCRIAEMMLSELCAYQNYLLAKREDDLTLIGKTGSKTFAEVEEEVRGMKDYLDIEQIRSRKAMHNAILFYNQFEQNYRRHAWLIGIHEGLEDVVLRLSAFRDKIMNTWPAKFIDASIP